MANKNIFQTRVQKAPSADTTNRAGGAAYTLSDKEALAQLVMTGTFNNTFYASAADQIDNVKTLLDRLGEANAEFIAKLAVHARDSGFMKDTPAYLVAWLSSHGGGNLFKDAFNATINNGKMLRNFVQVMRSGATGRKSLGTAPKKLVQNWIVNASSMQLLRASVGNDPSLADIFKMVHPRPTDARQAVFFKWLVGNTITSEEMTLLPSFVQNLIAFRKGDTLEIPNVPFELLTSMELSTNDWKVIARNAGWHMTRMNLNTFSRKGILNDPEIVHIVASRLMDREEIAKARVMPYQILTTYLNTKDDLPSEISAALERAMEHSLSNVPEFDGNTLVFVDVSGSMSSAITGTRKGSTSKMRCVDVAALIASSLLRRNPKKTKVVMFDTKTHREMLDPAASVMKNAQIIARFGGGGTACQIPMLEAVARKEKASLVIYISDNESWLNTSRWGYSKATETAEAWERFKKINPDAKLVCIDLQPGVTTQVKSDPTVLNVGGFNDAVYKVIQDFTEGDGSNDFWTRMIEKSASL